MSGVAVSKNIATQNPEGDNAPKPTGFRLLIFLLHYGVSAEELRTGKATSCWVDLRNLAV